MDAYHRYMRPPPPPSTADPYHQYQLQQPPPPQPPPRPPQGPWYSNQFHYQSPPPPPPPPPPPSQQWATPPPPPPTPPGSMPFHAVHGQFPPRPPLPHPPPQSPYPNSYPPQEWSNPNWGYQQNWSHPAHSDAEDWAARAKAWADAKAAMENQHLQSQYTPSGRLEEQSIYHNPYPPAVDSHYAENYQQPQLGHGHQQHSHSATPPQGPTLYPSEVATVSSGPSAYLPNGGSPFSARDGAMTGHANLGHHQQESLPTNASVHQQEVPSSYSSVSGHEDIADKGEKPLHWHTSAAQEGLQLSRPSVAGSVSFDKLGPYSSQPVEPVTDPADQPLQFTPKFTRERESLLQSGYAHHPNPAATASANAWTSSIVGDFSSVPSIHPSGPQHDLPVASAMPGHAAPPFARYSGTSFQPTVPSPGGSFGLGTGTALPPPAFAGDAYGVSNISERPKKAPVPNWLREEIIKNKAAITSTPLGHPKDEDHSVEDEDTDKSYRKTDEGEDKSVDSSRSAEDDDDDEDEAEVVRTAAINQEIKRVLTEVLLKVTDELFDEIATKVLNEDDLATSDGRTTISATVAPSPGKVAKAPALVDVKEAETEGVSENSGSSSTGNILGLANYASDDEDDVDRREVQNSSGPNITKDAVPLRSGDERVADAVNEASENGSPSVKMEDLGSTIGSVLASKKNNSDDVTNLSDGKGDDMKKPDEMVKSASGGSIDGMAFNFQEVHDDSNISGVRDAREDATLSKHPSEDVMVKSKSDHSRDRDNKSKSGRGDSDGSKRLSTGKDSYKELDSVKDKVDRKMDENWRKGERDLRKEMTDRLDYRDTRKELHKSGERVKESQSKKRLKDLDGKDDRKETERSRRPSAREGDCRSERLKDKEEDRSRSRLSNDSRRHKRRRSSSSGSRGRNSKENSISHAKSSSDEVSDDSRRKSQSRRHNRSPSPMRSKRRQSRSPHSKHSQRRHSPYSSLENARERRTKR